MLQPQPPFSYDPENLQMLRNGVVQGHPMGQHERELMLACVLSNDELWGQTRGQIVHDLFHRASEEDLLLVLASANNVFERTRHRPSIDSIFADAQQVIANYRGTEMLGPAA